MRVEEILEQMDKNIKLLNESLEVSTSLYKSDVKERYGSIKTYNECVAMERGAVSAMISLRQWIVNKHSVEKHQSEYSYEQLLISSFGENRGKEMYEYYCKQSK
jgi:hypothetical protein